ncbi:MAG: citryl-CoA lyase [Gammaproteobacteria bacterium]
MSSEEKKQEVIHTKIWREEPEPDNPFAAKKCFCAGYDVYGDLLGKASWVEYLYLLFKLEKPTKEQAKLLETIAVAIANPGIRDHSVRAAMNAGVGGSTAASTLMAALAVGAGQYGGAREVYLLLKIWEKCGTDIVGWKQAIKSPPKPDLPDSWPEIKHPIGFDPNCDYFSSPLQQILDQLIEFSDGESLNWLQQNKIELEAAAGCPLSLSSVIAAALHDLEFNHEQGEMLFLILRLPGAAVHGLEQKHNGWRKFPFFGDALKVMNDPLGDEKSL